MSTPRHRLFLVRLVLVWFVLSLGGAMASPLLQPKAMQLVCTASGALKLAAQTPDAQPDGAGPTLDCPLCAALGAPPATLQMAWASDRPLTHVQRPGTGVATTRMATSALPARGPPAHCQLS